MLRSVLPLLGLLAGLWPAAHAAVRLSGRVTNENDAPLGGAKLILRPAAQPTRRTYVYTDPSGHYSTRLPAPGDYLVDVERISHFPLRHQRLHLVEGDNRADFTLNRAKEVFEKIEVVATAPPIDMDTTTSQETVTGSQILNIPDPTTNNLRNAFRMVPGIVQDARGRLHINGGRENQALYTLDGFDITDPLTGRLESRLSVEAVQTVDVIGGRVPAQYGRGSAGVLAIHTKTGDDQFRASATNFVPSVEFQKGLTISGWTPRFNLSGPIRRGRAWFSDSLDTQFTNSIVKELPKGHDRTSSWRFGNHLGTQINLTPANILYTGLLVNAWTAPRTGLSVLDPRETTVDRRTRQWFFHTKDQIYLPHQMLVEFGYAANRTFGRLIPQGHQIYEITPEGRRGNYFLDSVRKASRDQVLVNAFLPAFHLAGEHRLKAGTDLDHLTYRQNARRTGIENLTAALIPVRRTLFAGNGRVRIHNYEAALYLEDSWHPWPGLLVESGVRGDWDQILHYWTVSPRLGIAWSPPGLESTKITGGYGILHDATNLAVFTRPRDQYSLTTYFDEAGRPVGGPAITVFTIRQSRLPRPRYRNVSLGFEQQWRGGIHSTLEYLRKRGRFGFTYINTLAYGPPQPPAWMRTLDHPQFDAIYDLTNDRRDAYDSFRVTLRQTIRRKYEWLVSYTRSRARSNAVIDASIDEPLLVSDNIGPMPWDAPNHIQSWGYLPTPFQNWAVAYLLEWRTGFPFSMVNDQGQVIGNVNALRYPAYFALNIHLERRFSFHGQLWAFRMGCNNISNHSNPNVVNNNITSPNFLRFYGGAGRSVNFRIRWLGKSGP